MDRWFDDVSRRVASARSRREVLAVLLGGLAAGATACVSSMASPSTTCAAGECVGSDNHCYGPCSGGAYCTRNPSGRCSSPSAGGVYCCTGSSGSSSGGGTSSSCHCDPGNTYNFLTGVCCPSTSPYYHPGTHGYARGCYASCPYIGDCGSAFQRC